MLRRGTSCSAIRSWWLWGVGVVIAVLVWGLARSESVRAGPSWGVRRLTWRLLHSRLRLCALRLCVVASPLI